MALSEQGSVTSSDHPFSLIDALDDDVLSLVLASLGVRWLGAVAQACRRTRSHSRDTVLLRKVLHHALTAHQWRVREDQLLHLPLASVLLLLRQPPDSAPLKRLDATRLPRKLSVSEDGVSARFLGERLGGNRCVRACAPLPVAAYHALRPPRAPPALPPASPPRSDRRSEGSNAASDGGDGGGGGRLGLRLGPPPAAGFQLERGCCIGYFEVSILPPPQGRGAAEHGFEPSCIAVGVCTSRFVCDGRQPGWDAESYGYHGDDGRLFHGSGTQSLAYGPRFQSGDVVGCGVSARSRRIFFTLNGAYLGSAVTAKPLQLPLYPVVGIDSFSPVTFNFGAEPFAFDLTEAPAALHASRSRMRISRCFGSALL